MQKLSSTDRRVNADRDTEAEPSLAIISEFWVRVGLVVLGRLNS